MKAAALVLSATLSLATQAAEPILIGQSAPLSGPAAAAGKAFVDGAKAYLDEINRAGGVQGRPVALRTLDDAYDPKRAASNAETLVNAGAIGLFGFVNTPTAMAGAQVAQARRVPFIAPATGATALRDKDKDMVFNIRASFKDEVTRIATHLQTTGVKRVSFFSLLIPESKIMFEHLGEHLGRSGLKYFSVANVTPDAIDIPKAARELKPAETHAVVMFCPGKMCADLAREVRQQGGLHVTFYTISSAGDVFSPLAEQGASIAVSQVMPYPWIPGQFSVVNQYQKAMSQAGKTDYGYWSLEGYVSARVLVEGLRRMSGSPSPQALATAMRSLGTLDIGNLEITPGAAPSNSRGAFTEITLARAGGRYRR